MSRTMLCLCAALVVPTAFGQDTVEKRLNESPRHHEWVQIPAGEGRVVHAFVAHPESDSDARAVIVIHENRGLTEWVRAFADRLAESGYVAIAPDLLSGFDDARDRTGEFADPDAARSAIYELDPDRVTADLLAVQEFASALPGVSGKPAVAGFCWGGSQSFRFATNSDGIAAALVFYGTGPDDGEAVARINAPVFGFYGADDQRVNATIPGTEALMEKHGKTYEYEIYQGAGHAFMRQGAEADAPTGAREARERAWARLERILGRLD